MQRVRDFLSGVHRAWLTAKSPEENDVHRPGSGGSTYLGVGGRSSHAGAMEHDAKLAEFRYLVGSE